MIPSLFSALYFVHRLLLTVRFALFNPYLCVHRNMRQKISKNIKHMLLAAVVAAAAVTSLFDVCYAIELENSFNNSLY